MAQHPRRNRDGWDGYTTAQNQGKKTGKKLQKEEDRIDQEDDPEFDPDNQFNEKLAYADNMMRGDDE